MLQNAQIMTHLKENQTATDVRSVTVTAVSSLVFANRPVFLHLYSAQKGMLCL